MQVTIDIPESRFGELAPEARLLQTTVQELVERRLLVTGAVLPGTDPYTSFPLIQSNLSGSMDAVKEDSLDFLDPS